jgi:hypothetical protein
MGTTFPAETVNHITNYIKHNATKEPPALHGLIDQGNRQLAGMLDGMSDAQARWKPAPGDWCALELLHHVVSAKRGVARICARLASGETLPGTGREGDEQDGVTRGDPFASLADARAALDVAHRETLAFVDGPLATANCDTRFSHFVFGDLNCREWAAFQRVHDGDHSQQIEKIKSAAGYPA